MFMTKVTSGTFIARHSLPIELSFKFLSGFEHCLAMMAFENIRIE